MTVKSTFIGKQFIDVFNQIDINGFTFYECSMFSLRYIHIPSLCKSIKNKYNNINYEELIFRASIFEKVCDEFTSINGLLKDCSSKIIETYACSNVKKIIDSGNQYCQIKGWNKLEFSQKMFKDTIETLISYNKKFDTIYQPTVIISEGFFNFWEPMYKSVGTFMKKDLSGLYIPKPILMQFLHWLTHQYIVELENYI